MNEKIYKQLRKDFLKDQPECVVKVDGCTKKATDVHHAAGRGACLNVVEYFVPVCRNCHTWIETHPIEAKEMGHSISRITKPIK